LPHEIIQARILLRRSSADGQPQVFDRPISVRAAVHHSNSRVAQFEGRERRVQIADFRGALKQSGNVGRSQGRIMDDQTGRLDRHDGADAKLSPYRRQRVVSQQHFPAGEDAVGVVGRQPFPARCAGHNNVEQADSIEDGERRRSHANATEGELLQKGLGLGADALRVGVMPVRERPCADQRQPE
jgi:hypothetical protein